MRPVIFIVFLLSESSGALSEVYNCQVEKKVDSERIYAAELIERYQYSVKIEEQGEVTKISRCTISSEQGKTTCDQYGVDKVVIDKNVNIKKYYMFQQQFDVQLFSDLSFIENNGRGSIAFGSCVIINQQ